MTKSPAFYDWLVLAAIALGPLLGIWVTRIIDRQKDKAKRREKVFEDLIRTRGLELSTEHVGALNMVPFLFKEARVREEYRRVIECLNDPAMGDTGAAGEGVFQRLMTARKDLVREVASAVRSPLPESDMERLGYAPKAWISSYADQEKLRSLLIDALEGKGALHTLAWVRELPAPSPQEGAAADSIAAGGSETGQLSQI